MSDTIQENQEIAEELASEEIKLEEIEKQFETPSFFDRVRMLLRGLKAPAGSREYKEALIEMQRLLAPVGAIVIPLIFVAILFVCSVPSKSNKDLRDINVAKAEEDATLDEPPPEMEDTVEQNTDQTVETEVMNDITNPSLDNLATPTDVVAPSTDNAPTVDNPNAVMDIQAPVKMNTVLGQSRSAAARARSLAKFGGDAETERCVMRALRWLKTQQRPDGSWKKYDRGPVTRNGFQFGEDYDARQEVDGWKDGGFDDSAWAPADLFERPAPGVQIQAYVGLPIQNNITLDAISVTEPVKGTFVYDFGQNVIGVPRLEGMKGKAGQVVNLRYGEMIYPERIPTEPVAPYTIEMYKAKKGQVYVENYRGAISIDNYTMRGSKDGETYQPIFTDHGFRYVSVTGLDKPLPISSVKAVVLESIGNTTSDYESSNADINRLFQNIQWGQRDNFQAVPTDCPQRDERQGWTGDAQVFARTATYFSPWVDKFYARWFYSMRDNQNYDGSYFNYYPVTGRPPYGFTNDNPGWMGWMEAGILVPYQVWEQYGDIRVLQDHWDSMERYMDYLERQANPDGTQVSSGIGDHLAIERTDIGLTNTAYYAYDAYMMSRMAEALGKTREARKYAALHDKVKAAFVKKYFNEDGVSVAPYVAFRFPGMPANPNAPKDGTLMPVGTQTSYALPLRFGLLDGELRDKAVAHLVEDIEKHDNTLTTGFIGTPYLNLALSENGRDDVAYTLFEQTKYPSWLYPVLQGATTMWERWNSYTIENGFGWI